MNDLQVFTNEAFGSVRTVVIEGEPWFVGKDVADILAYKNPNEAIQEHVDDEDKFLRSERGRDLLKLFSSLKDIQEKFGRQDNWFINESGVYSLVFGSRKPEAKAFKWWITHEVIPSIRKTGAYSLPTIKAYTPADAIYLMGDISKALQATLAIREGIALAKGLEMAQEATGVNLEPVRELLPPAQHETGYLNPTQIGKRVSLSARKVNDKLREMGLQRKDSSGWRLEDAGREYGEEMPYSKNGHAGYQIRWNSRVIEVLGEVQ